MFAERLVVVVSLTVLIAVGYATAPTRDVSAAGSQGTTRDGILLWPEQVGTRHATRSLVKTSVFMASPDETDHALFLRFRLVNRSESNVVLSPRDGRHTLRAYQHTLVVQPAIESEITVLPGQAWSKETTIRFGRDLPLLDFDVFTIQYIVFYQHAGHRGCVRLTAQSAFPEVPPSARRLDEVLDTARRAAAAVHPGKCPRWKSIGNTNGAWTVTFGLRPGFCGSRVELDPDDVSVKSQRFLIGCVRL
jgi:hypothetical protein